MKKSESRTICITLAFLVLTHSAHHDLTKSAKKTHQNRPSTIDHKHFGTIMAASTTPDDSYP
jgi:hypothetical protein